MKKIKVLYLTNNDNALELYKWLNEKCNAILYKDKISLSYVMDMKPDMIISFNYQYIIGQQVISYMKGKIFNLHISYLPWNRGADPNLWSIIDDTPKGVTIHQIDETLDTGNIIFQEYVELQEDAETLKSSYDKLINAITKLFQKHWNELVTGCYELKRQGGEGSYHKAQDLKNILDKENLDLDMKITDFRKNVMR